MTTNEFINMINAVQKQKYKRQQYLPFEKAKIFARSLKIRGCKEWLEYANSGKIPAYIPFHPNRIYKNQGWVGWKDFLGKSFVSLEKAHKYALSLKLNSYRQWRKLVISNKIPENIPKSPDQVYKNQGWKNWGDFLGTGNISLCSKIYRPFKQARKYVRELNLRSITQWREYCKSGNRPEDIPAGPHLYYKEWINWRDYLGIEYGNKHKYLSFIKARKYVRALKLKNENEWRKYLKSGQKPSRLPSAPHYKYKGKGWKGWGDFLGTYNISCRDIQFLPFPKVRIFARSLKLHKYEEWKKYCKSGRKPSYIPSRPDNKYRNKGWTNWRDFLGIKSGKQKDK